MIFAIYRFPKTKNAAFYWSFSFIPSLVLFLSSRHSYTEQKALNLLNSSVLPKSEARFNLLLGGEDESGGTSQRWQRQLLCHDEVYSLRSRGSFFFVFLFMNHQICLGFSFWFHNCRFIYCCCYRLLHWRILCRLMIQWTSSIATCTKLYASVLSSSWAICTNPFQFSSISFSTYEINWIFLKCVYN